MKKIDKKLIETANIINSKFEKTTMDNREEISTDILPHFRHFCEAVMYKIYDEDNNEDLFLTQDNLKKVRNFIKGKYYDIYINFIHYLMQVLDIWNLEGYNPKH